MDYPFNLKGILYFPRINTEYDSIEGTIKLYNNQVFIADNIKEVIPEYLMLLKGVIDCPDLPLNVSRSALQNDGFVKKISEYISKKFADKLSGMCKTDRENYEKYWDDINPFIKYGCIKDEKFSKKMMDYILFKNIDGKYLTLEDCINENKKEEAPAENTEEKAETTENTENTENADEKKEPENDCLLRHRRSSAEPVHQHVPQPGHGCCHPETQHRLRFHHPCRALQRACNFPAHRCRSDQRYERRVR